MRTMMLITLVTLMTMAMAKSEETKTISPTVVVENVKQLPTKVSDWSKSEWQKTKDFQKASWEDAKTKWPWNKIFKGKNNE